MKIIVNSNEVLSKLIAEEFVNVVLKKPNAVLGLATGTSPLGVYANMAKAYEEGRVSFAKCTTFNLDEYVGLEGTHNQSYRYFMNENLFNHIDIDKKKIPFFESKQEVLFETIYNEIIVPIEFMNFLEQNYFKDKTEILKKITSISKNGIGIGDLKSDILAYIASGIVPIKIKHPFNYYKCKIIDTKFIDNYYLAKSWYGIEKLFEEKHFYY